jgi:hypothetical protein
MYLVLVVSSYFADDWWEASILSTILPINIKDFLSAKSEYFLQILQHETLSESSSKHE